MTKILRVSLLGAAAALTMSSVAISFSADANAREHAKSQHSRSHDGYSAYGSTVRGPVGGGFNQPQVLDRPEVGGG